MKRVAMVAVGVALALVLFGVVEARFVFAPLLGLLIWRIGLASFGSLRRGGAHIPDGPPQRVDPSTERVVYACEGCGAELLLLARGADVPPRHCGERMTLRREVPHGVGPLS